MLDLDKLTGHTPGKWRHDSGLVPPDGPERYANIYVNGGDLIIANFNNNIPEGLANARLIAASPELLEMARKLQAENDRLREAAKPIADFITAFDAKPLRQVDDEFYGIHAGSEWEASIRLSHFRALKEAMELSNA